MNKSRKRYIKECEVSELVKLELGGYIQKVLIEGKSKDLPVVICLHGGPGSPVPFSVGGRGLFPEWTDKAIMVYWDQLGCGANNYRIDDDFSIDTFIGMTCDLVQEIKARFPQNKLFLFGISWGSILALKCALRMPEKINGVLVYGQIIKNLFFNDEILHAFDKAPLKIRNSVQRIIDTGADCEYSLLDENLKRLYKYLNKYTDAYINKNSKPAPVGKIVKGLLTSPDYSFKDFKAVMKNGYRGNTTLWRELLKSDFTADLSRLQVKYIILQGDTDLVASTSNILITVADSKNENVTVKVINNSGHMPAADAMDECYNTFLDLIK